MRTHDTQQIDVVAQIEDSSACPSSFIIHHSSLIIRHTSAALCRGLTKEFGTGRPCPA